ncbi:MAG: CmcJ/NvfI family oxidoreductase [Pseudomonadota bacterium]
MPRTASVNYHVHRPERQAFHIDAGGVVGRMISPELVATEVRVSDARGDDAAVRFADDGLAFFETPTSVASFAAADGWQAAYDAELTDLLTRELGAREVVVFDHTVRVDDPASDRKPARNVHSDYSPEGAEKRLVDILGEARAAEWRGGRYGFINVWRPVEAPINSAPLGFVRPSSVSLDDWILIDLIYPDRRGHIMGLAANPKHDWIYRSTMTPDETAVFSIYDNRGLPSIAHSALDMVEDLSVTTIRKSVESRTLVRY